MPSRHPEPQPEDPESVYATFLTTDIRPLIRSARPAALLAAHDAVARHLRRYVTGDLARPYDSTIDPPSLRPAFLLYCQAEKAAAATLLLALGTTCHASGPASPPGPARLRRTLLDLADAITTLYRDADTAAASISAITGSGLPDDVHAIGLGVITAARLHFHAARTQAIHLLYHLWNHLDPGPNACPASPAPSPFPRPPATPSPSTEDCRSPQAS